jgi:hypothetical protein
VLPQFVVHSIGPSLTLLSSRRLHLAILRDLEDAEGDGWRKNEFHHQPADLSAVNGVQLRHHHVGLRHQHRFQARLARVLRHDPGRSSRQRRVPVHDPEQRHAAAGEELELRLAHARKARLRHVLRGGRHGILRPAKGSEG